MKRIIKIMVCLVLGAITTSCLFGEEILLNSTSDAIFCEPATETHYTVYCAGTKGSRISTLAPYIYEAESHEENNVVDAFRVGDYLYMYDNPHAAKFYTVDGINLMEKNYKVSLFFDTYVVRYHFVVVLPEVCSPECKHYEPTFEFVDCVTKVLGDEDFNGKLYYCTEATVTLRVYQGEEVFDFVKTVKLRQEYVDVSFDVTIDSGFDGNNNNEV